MPARCLATILPAMSLAAALETTRIHRVADLIGGARTSNRQGPAGAEGLVRHPLPASRRLAMGVQGSGGILVGGRRCVVACL
jgi:hypothetical protein